MMTSRDFIRCKCRIDVKRFTVEFTNNLDDTLRTNCCSPSNVPVHPCTRLLYCSNVGSPFCLRVKLVLRVKPVRHDRSSSII